MDRWDSSSPLWKKSCARARELCKWLVWSFNTRPRGKSGLWSSGVIGPGEGVSARDLHATLKICNVAPISEWDIYVFEADFWLIHGRLDSGVLANESSSVIQSLSGRCKCQSTILVRWHAQWYFWRSGKPKPPDNLGRTNLSQLNLGVLAAQMKLLHISLYEWKKDVGSLIGIAWKRSRQDVHFQNGSSA